MLSRLNHVLELYPNLVEHLIARASHAYRVTCRLLTKDGECICLYDLCWDVITRLHMIVITWEYVIWWDLVACLECLVLCLILCCLLSYDELPSHFLLCGCILGVSTRSWRVQKRRLGTWRILPGWYRWIKATERTYIELNDLAWTSTSLGWSQGWRPFGDWSDSYTNIFNLR